MYRLWIFHNLATRISYIHFSTHKVETTGFSRSAFSTNLLPICERIRISYHMEAVMKYRYGSHTVYNIENHFVWVTKYRYQVLVGEVGERRLVWPDYVRWKPLSDGWNRINQDNQATLATNFPSRAYQHQGAGSQQRGRNVWSRQLSDKAILFEKTPWCHYVGIKR